MDPIYSPWLAPLTAVTLVCLVFAAAILFGAINKRRAKRGLH